MILWIYRHDLSEKIRLLAASPLPMLSRLGQVFIHIHSAGTGGIYPLALILRYYILPFLPRTYGHIYSVEVMYTPGMKYEICTIILRCPTYAWQRTSYIARISGVVILYSCLALLESPSSVAGRGNTGSIDTIHNRYGTAGYVKVKPGTRRETSVEGVYAAGDVQDKERVEAGDACVCVCVWVLQRRMWNPPPSETAALNGLWYMSRFRFWVMCMVDGFSWYNDTNLTCPLTRLKGWDLTSVTVTVTVDDKGPQRAINIRSNR